MKRVYVVMCANDTCCADVQVHLREVPLDDVVNARCPMCDEQFEFHVPPIAEVHGS